MGRLKKEYSNKIREKLLDVLQTNANAITDGQKTPLNLTQIFDEINNFLNETGTGIALERRSIHNLLREYSDMGIVDKKKGEGEKRRERYYYYKKHSSPSLFWHMTLEPFLHSMKVRNGLISFGTFPFGRIAESESAPKKLVGIRMKAALIGNGIDIVSKLPWEDHARDIMEPLIQDVEENLKKEFRFHYGINGSDNIHSATAKLLAKKLKGKKLAFIYVLDGSEFITYEFPPADDKMRKEWLDKKFASSHKSKTDKPTNK